MFFLYWFRVFVDNFGQNLLFQDYDDEWNEFDLLFKHLIVSWNMKDSFTLSGLLEQDDNWISLGL